jgi:hypothetical protein
MEYNDWHPGQRPERRSSPRPYHPPSYGQPNEPRPHNPQTLHKECCARIQRKIYVLSLMENGRGRYLRLTEESNGRQNFVVIPVEGLPEIEKMLAEVKQAITALPPANPVPPNP